MRLIPAGVDKLHPLNHLITITIQTKTRRKSSMAELVAATVGVLLEKAISLAAGRIGLVLGFHKDLEALRGYALDIQAVLADAETKQSPNPIVLRWLQKVEPVAFEASYILDELLYESLRRQVESRNKSKGPKVCLFFIFSKHDISFRWRMSSKVRDINDKLKILYMEGTASVGLIRMADLLLPARDVNATSEVAKTRPTDSLRPQFVVGREREESKIGAMLLGYCDRCVFVHAIVGMGGLGKTTLAKSVYNNESIDGHFGKKGWFCVSDKFEVTEVLRGILESLKGVRVARCGRDALVQQIQNELNGERFLFVLDDVWNEDGKLWDDFYSSLAAINAASGSCCLLTTRLQTTANLVSTLAPFTLEKLLDDDCWSIFTQRATKGGDIIPETLKVHKSQILRRCQGLPLAANAIGGLLSLHNREDWLSVVENKVLKVSEDVGGEIMPILRLSFDNLPSSSIKKCFAYCSIYAKDEKMEGVKLVQLWMAEGLLQDDAERRKTMEEVGASYLLILLQSSLLEKADGQLLSYYRMHDLVHDLAESVSKQKGFDFENNYQVRHLILEKRIVEIFWNVRSPLAQIVKGGISNELLSKFKFLHVLNLLGAIKDFDKLDINNLARSISKLKHLRYLAIEYMPESLCKLYSLQTLYLNRGYSVKCLPQGFNNLINLRHLHFYSSNNELRMPPEMGRLTCLQTLEFFNVGKERNGGIEQLGFMQNLGGKLEIRNLSLVKGKEGAMSATLYGKKNLVELELNWDHRADLDNDKCGDEHVLEGLEPHPNLKELRIIGFMGVRFPQWMGGLSALVNLKFYDCKNCTNLPTLGHLPYLEILEIWSMINVVRIGNSFYDAGVFPSLKSLRMYNMTNLREWKESESARDSGHLFPKLETLHLEKCNELAIAPSYFPSLNTLGIEGNLNSLVARDIISKCGNLLKKLTLRNVGGMSSVSDVITSSLTSLEELEICDCYGLIDIPGTTLECCTSLKILKLESCLNLVSCSLDFEHMPSISRLSFYKCPNLVATRGFSHLINLMTLSMGPFSDDSIQLFAGFGLLTCSSTVQQLKWYGSLQKQFSLPEQFQHFTSLLSLALYDFESVETLPDWLGNLTSLRTLDLFNFPRLRCLPSAEAMASLTKLYRLGMYSCPILKESWDQKMIDSCSEWSKISCLPNLHVFFG